MHVVQFFYILWITGILKNEYVNICIIQQIFLKGFQITFLELMALMAVKWLNSGNYDSSIFLTITTTFPKQSECKIFDCSLLWLKISGQRH